MRRAVLLVATVLGLVLAGFTLVVGGLQREKDVARATAPAPSIGRVVDASGRGLRARVELLPEGGGEDPRAARVDADGRFRARLTRPTLARLSAAGYLSRVVALDPRRADDFVLTPRARDGLSIRFGGDVMMGRRFFTAEPGRPAQLSEEPTRAELAAPLATVAPMLGDADLTVVNLETALVRFPWFKGPRPRWVHPEKELVVTSPLGLAPALKDAGVDIVDLANNHVFDGRDRGVAKTIETVEKAGLAHFGAGPTIRDAWQPAYVARHGQRVAFVGCTTVDGAQHELGYVATADHGGAARCGVPQLHWAMNEAKRNADTVVFMLHGGTEYVREQTDEVRDFSRLAVDLGASVVVDGHPHVVGGVSSDRGVPIVESAGNLLFDQDLWDTFVSYLPRVELSGTRVARTVLDPILLDGYRPAPVVGRPADAAARIGAGTLDGPLALVDGGAASPSDDEAAVPDSISASAGQVTDLPDGAWLAPGQQARTGRDLLFGTGDFERVLPGQAQDAAPLWTLGRFAEVAHEASCTGTKGLLMRRAPVSQRDVVAAPAHRQAVEPGQRVTLVADVAQASAGAYLELRWYAGMEGASVHVSRFHVPRVSPRDGCTQVRFDVTVPAQALAVQPWLRLRPPHDINLAAHFAVDDVRLVAWSGTPSRRDDVVDPLVDGPLTVTRDPAYR